MSCERCAASCPAAAGAKAPAARKAAGGVTVALLGQPN